MAAPLGSPHRPARATSSIPHFHHPVPHPNSREQPEQRQDQIIFGTSIGDLPPDSTATDHGLLPTRSAVASRWEPFCTTRVSHPRPLQVGSEPAILGSIRSLLILFFPLPTSRQTVRPTSLGFPRRRQGRHFCQTGLEWEFQAQRIRDATRSLQPLRQTSKGSRTHPLSDFRRRLLRVEFLETHLQPRRP